MQPINIYMIHNHFPVKITLKNNYFIEVLDNTIINYVQLIIETVKSVLF